MDLGVNIIGHAGKGIGRLKPRTDICRFRTLVVFWTSFVGAGSWSAMPDDRKEKFSHALKPNFHEWDAVMNEETSLLEWERDLPGETTVISAADTVKSIDEIYKLLSESISG